jgi:predicted adenylyl cyclase CyaB
MQSDNDKNLPPAAVEIEVKILEIDRAVIERRLIELGAKMVFDGKIHAVYFDLPDQRLRASGLTLRLRSEGPKAVLTLKTDVRNPEAKEREERETEVGDFTVMRGILETLAFAPWLEMKKHRTSYELPDGHVEIDRYQDEFGYIPEFVEIEGRDIKSVHSIAAALGFGKDDCKPWDAVQLADYYHDRRRDARGG